MGHVYLSSRQCQQVDRRAIEEFGMSGLVLMENAGRGATDVLVGLMKQAQPSTASQGPVVVCCGGGNNGGDGLVMARHLDLRGYAVQVLLWADPTKLTSDAAANFEIIQKSDVPLTVFGTDHDGQLLASILGPASWIIDALLGTGARGEPRPLGHAPHERDDEEECPHTGPDESIQSHTQTPRSPRHSPDDAPAHTHGSPVE